MRRFSLIALILTTLSACSIFGSSDEISDSYTVRPTVMGVNGYLWQASLDTLEFMPIESADQANGFILTDWMVSPNNPNERVKLTVRFLSDELRSDAVRVIVNRQNLVGGTWVIAQAQASTALQIEEAILTQARQLRVEGQN